MDNKDTYVTVDKDWLLKKCRNALSYIKEQREYRLSKIGKWEVAKRSKRNWIMKELYKNDYNLLIELVSTVFDPNVKEITISFKTYLFLKSL